MNTSTIEDAMPGDLLRKVDPRAKRGLLYRAYANLMGTRGVLWIRGFRQQ